ncbi:MAG: DMT family transporter [Propionivibrio sp.]
MQDRSLLLRGYLAAAATLVMWTGFSLFSRYAGKSVLTPYDVFALRLSVAALVLLPFAPRFLGQGAWRDQRLWLLASLGSLLYCLVVYTGFRYAPAAHGAILLSGMQPFLISAIVLAVDGIRPNRMRTLGLIGIATGIACAAVPYFNVWSPEVVFGDLLIFSGSVLWAIYSVLAKRWGYSPWTLTSAVALIPAVLYLPIYALFLPKALAEAPLALIVTQGLYQGIVATILAMLAYLKAISILGTERAAVFLALVPITTGLAAVPLLGEALTGWLLSGLVFVSLGSFVASRYGGSVSRN